MSAPIQCSDDVANSQTGREMDVADLQSATSARDLATDALADQRPLPPPAASMAAASRCAGDGGAQKRQDQVVIKGAQGTIHATGLAENLSPGAFMQIGVTNHMAVHNYADGSTHTATTATAPVRNRLKITDNQAVPDHRHLSVVSQGLTGDWRSVGRRLGLADPALEHIWLENKDSGLQEVNHQMLRKWMASCYPASVHALAVALADTGHGDLADKLTQMS